MANTKIINYQSPAGDVGVYGQVTDTATGKVWNGTVVQTWVDANVDTYDVAAVYQGGSRYLWTIPSTLPTGANYQVVFKKRSAVGAAAALTDFKLPDELEFAWNGSATSSLPPGSADWYYADQTDVTDLLGSDGLRIISNVDSDDSAIDTARLQRAGEDMDAWMDGMLEGMPQGYTVPLAAMNARTVLIMSKISAELVAVELNKAHLLNSPKLTASQIDRIMEGHHKHAMNLIRSIRLGTLKITATKAYDDTSKIAIAGGPSDDSVTTCAPVYWWP